MNFWLVFEVHLATFRRRQKNILYLPSMHTQLYFSPRIVWQQKPTVCLLSMLIQLHFGPPIDMVRLTIVSKLRGKPQSAMNPKITTSITSSMATTIRAPRRDGSRNRETCNAAAGHNRTQHNQMRLFHLLA